ncbi:MAG: DNA-processing protein DprA [Candidatus Omnitrophota bacterium]
MNDREYLIALNMISGLGSVRIAGLLDFFKTPRQIFEAEAAVLAGFGGLGKIISGRIKTILSSQIFEDELRNIKKLGIHVISLLDAEYPQTLKNIYDPPAVLYVKGDTRCLSNLSVAIVGCRKASTYGLKQAEKIAGELSQNGVCVVSGMARGIDTAAHKGALAARGKTVAVLGSGLSVVYPPENQGLFEKIAKQGAVISEFSLQSSPVKSNFPRRNRIISGLSKAVVVVEAMRQSGSLITADFALEQGREVYAVPGAANSLNAQGTNKLIKEGAKLVENAQDILEEFIKN